MPVIKYFPYKGPNRRSDLPVVEVLLKFGSGDETGFPQQVSDIRDLLINGGILTREEAFPGQTLPEQRMEWFASLLVQTALLFQRKAGHKVNYFSVSSIPGQGQCLALVEHEHCDVGMTAVKLACDLLTGNRRLLAEPFRMFREFATDRLLPVETWSITRAARRRDIPVTHLERNPMRREDFDEITGGRCIRPNGLIMLGFGRHQHVLDGTFCVDLAEDFTGLFKTASRRPGAGSLPGAGASALDQAAEALLDRLFPSNASSRIPIIAITGTNGKTTTTRMVSHIMSHTGRNTGMVCTDGVFLNGKALAKGDQSARIGHFKVLTSKEADFAVLETHHKGMLHDGFAFHSCDIAICLNVTADHLGEGDIETVAQMAEIKSSLPERASQAAVLNADDMHCIDMLAKVKAKQAWLVSMELDRSQLFERYGNKLTGCCVLELIDDRQHLVIHDRELRIPVMAADSIPACFGGTAHFNVSNAMHAVSASYLAGVDIESIRAAMSSFTASWESTPGRLNVFDDLPFRVIMDFAHNPDGMLKICEFVDKQKVVGRKLVAFAGSINRTDEVIRQMGRSVAGHFDFYFCKEHIRPDRKQPRTVAHLLRQGLMEMGVAGNKIAMTMYGKDVIFKIFDACEPGDLLVMLMGHVEKHHLPAYIREYARILEGGE